MGLGDSALAIALIAGRVRPYSPNSLSASESQGVAPSSSSGSWELRLVWALEHRCMAGNLYSMSCRSYRVSYSVDMLVDDEPAQLCIKLILGSKSRSTLISSSSAVFDCLSCEFLRLIRLRLPFNDFFLCSLHGERDRGGLALSALLFLALSARDLNRIACRRSGWANFVPQRSVFHR